MYDCCLLRLQSSTFHVFAVAIMSFNAVDHVYIVLILVTENSIPVWLSSDQCVQGKSPVFNNAVSQSARRKHSFTASLFQSVLSQVTRAQGLTYQESNNSNILSSCVSSLASITDRPVNVCVCVRACELACVCEGGCVGGGGGGRGGRG